jgi:glutathione S-transferase
MEKQLAQTAYLAENEYSLANIATYPRAPSSKKLAMEWSNFSHGQR